jgi:hypothetical protein
VSDLPASGGQPAERPANTAWAALLGGVVKACEGGSGGARGVSASWWGKGPPGRRRVGGLRGWPPTLGLRYGPDSYGRQQWGILRNGRKPDAATPRAGGRASACKPLSGGTKVSRKGGLTVPPEEAPANSVPAAAVIRRVRALFGITGRKARAGGLLSLPVKDRGSTPSAQEILGGWRQAEASGIPGVAVECVEIRKNTGGEGGWLGLV